MAGVVFERDGLRLINVDRRLQISVETLLINRHFGLAASEQIDGGGDRLAKLLLGRERRFNHVENDISCLCVGIGHCGLVTLSTMSGYKLNGSIFSNSAFASDRVRPRLSKFS